MQEVCKLKNAALVELDLSEIFYAGDVHRLISRQLVLGEVVDKLGYTQVDEEDVVEYAKLRRLDAGHWTFGMGRRFLMKPIYKQGPDGEQINICSPDADCGVEGYELGLWYDKRVDPPAEPEFPRLNRHPVQIAYCVLATLVVKKKL